MFFGLIKDSNNEWGFSPLEQTFVSYIEVDDELHMKLIDEANSNNKIIKADENGYPILVDPEPPSKKMLTQQQIFEQKNYLSSTDWYVLRFIETGKKIPNEIIQKRQQARDIISESRILITE